MGVISRVRVPLGSRAVILGKTLLTVLRFFIGGRTRLAGVRRRSRLGRATARGRIDRLFFVIRGVISTWATFIILLLGVLGARGRDERFYDWELSSRPSHPFLLQSLNNRVVVFLDL